MAKLNLTDAQHLFAVKVSKPGMNSKIEVCMPNITTMEEAISHVQTLNIGEVKFVRSWYRTPDNTKWQDLGKKVIIEKKLPEKNPNKEIKTQLLAAQAAADSEKVEEVNHELIIE